MVATKFTELVSYAVPIQQAGMGSFAPPELAEVVRELAEGTEMMPP